jgi:hypothetical protein
MYSALSIFITDLQKLVLIWSVWTSCSMGVHFGGVHNVELPGLDVQKCNVSLTVKRLFRPYKENNQIFFYYVSLNHLIHV